MKRPLYVGLVVPTPNPKQVRTTGNKIFEEFLVSRLCGPGRSRSSIRVKIGTAAQTVAGAAIGGDILARVMDKRNGRAGFTLQKAEVTE